MKKRIFAILMCVVLSSIFCVGAFATGDIGIIGGADGDTQIIVDDDSALYNDEYLYDDDFFYEYDDSYNSEAYTFYDDEEFMKEVEKSLVLSALSEDEETMQILYSMGIEKVKSFIACIAIAMVFGTLFTPVLIVLIVFAVLNGKAKKTIKEYEIKMNPMFSYGVANNTANLNYQPQTQPQVNQVPVVNGEPQATEETQGGEM